MPRTHTDNPATETSASSSAALAWTGKQRGLASLLIAAALFVVFMGPVTNPIATEELTGPIGRLLAPIHQTLYLSHGYRFFAPDPGPSHLLVYRLHYPDGRVKEKRFPDRESISPRLRYHRWFMLSETLYAEHAAQPDRTSFVRMQSDLAAQADRFARGGQPLLAEELRKSAERQRKSFTRSEQRIRELVQAVGRVLIENTGADRVELLCQERLIPLPGDVALGVKLNAPEGLLPAVKIGDVLADGSFIPPLVDAPAGEEEVAPQQPAEQGSRQ